MKDMDFSKMFIENVKPILDDAVTDYFTVKLSKEKVWVDDGYVPQRISIYNTCFATRYTYVSCYENCFQTLVYVYGTKNRQIL